MLLFGVVMHYQGANKWLTELLFVSWKGLFGCQRQFLVATSHQEYVPISVLLIVMRSFVCASDRMSIEGTSLDLGWLLKDFVCELQCRCAYAWMRLEKGNG